MLEAGNNEPTEKPTENPIEKPTESAAEQTTMETQMTTASAESGEGPQTGDDNLMAIWALIIFMSGAGVWFFGKKKNMQTQK